MHKTIVASFLLLPLLVSAGCGKSLSVLDQLAASGSIQEDAPIKTYLQIEIDARATKVWQLLTDAASWPKWQRDIESVKVAGPLAKGTRFSWRMGGTNIHSQVQLFEPEHRLGWTGTAMTAKAVHIWELRSESPGHTLVIMKESMNGPWMARIYPSEKLSQADRSWLEALKKAAEAHGSSN